MTRVLLHGTVTPGFEQRLAAAIAPEPLTIVPADDHAGLMRALETCELWLHVLEPIDAEQMDRAPNLRMIQKIGVGLNTIDLNAAKERGISVCNMPGSNSQAVAELTLLLMLGVLRRVATYDGGLRTGCWQPEDHALGDRTGEICGRTIGLIGFGRSARALAPVLTAMGATVLYSATAPHKDNPGAYRPLDALLNEADIVSLHLPLTKETENLVGTDQIAAMKPGAILINVSRGGLVDESALAQAIRSGHLSGAGLDVFATEPLPGDSELLSLPNVVVTPHIAWLTPETLDRSIAIIAENLRRHDSGEPFLHRAI